MGGSRSGGLLLFAILSMAAVGTANGITVDPIRADMHREAVDEQAYPWSAVGKLYNETGASCSGVVISRDKILTAAHCLYNERTQRFVSPQALHFLVGYRTGNYAAHVRIAHYEFGQGFDPTNYEDTLKADWAVLTATTALPLSIEPLRLRTDIAPSGTKAILVGYPQDRAFAMTADRNCELGISASYLQHTCRGINGYSGAPILVSNGDGEMEVAGIHIATGDSGEKMIAVPAQSILRDSADVSTPASAEAVNEGPHQACLAAENDGVRLDDLRANLGLDPLDAERDDRFLRLRALHFVAIKGFYAGPGRLSALEQPPIHFAAIIPGQAAYR